PKCSLYQTAKPVGFAARKKNPPIPVTRSIKTFRLIRAPVLLPDNPLSHQSINPPLHHSTSHYCVPPYFQMAVETPALPATIHRKSKSYASQLPLHCRKLCRARVLLRAAFFDGPNESIRSRALAGQSSARSSLPISRFKGRLGEKARASAFTTLAIARQIAAATQVLKSADHFEGRPRRLPAREIRVR